MSMFTYLNRDTNGWKHVDPPVYGNGVPGVSDKSTSLKELNICEVVWSFHALPVEEIFTSP